MTDELHERITISVAEVVELRKQLEQSRDVIRLLEEDVATWKGHAAALTDELDKTKARSDHNLNWACGITTQLLNIGLFVQDSLKTARQEVAKAGNGPAREAEGALAAVQRALAEAGAGQGQGRLQQGTASAHDEPRLPRPPQ